MPSRRDQIAMTPEEIRAYLTNERRLIIVSNGPGGYPHPMPMNFILDEADRLVVTTFRKSQKVMNFQRDPKAALLVESGLNYADLKSVLAYAEAEIVDDLDAVLQTMTRLAAKDGLTALAESARSQAPKRVLIRFKPHTYISWDHSKLGGIY